MIKRKLAKAMTALGVCLLISSSSKLNVTAIESAATVDYAPLAKIEAISAEMQQSGHLCSNCKTNMTYAGMQIVSRVLYQTEVCPGTVDGGDAAPGYHYYYRSTVHYNYRCPKCSSTYIEVGYLTDMECSAGIH
ncbi:hypothetical protein [Candidatus Acetatifactor stercoripullorum]|uniref:hypothetical protein n=1 Tax=Candidatus Acetatifactor stercoripullorum TaxID=2838414 RepID=UPI00298DB197|nr:hypothetical protein [Candidatus Acetatifactor stercoripullorum]